MECMIMVPFPLPHWFYRSNVLVSAICKSNRCQRFVLVIVIEAQQMVLDNLVDLRRESRSMKNPGMV